MPLQPTTSDVHINTALGNVMLAYMQNPANFIAADMIPVCPVQHQSNVYWIFDRSYWNRIQMSKRAPGTRAVASGFAVKPSNPYFCDVWALEKFIDDDTRANADPEINLEVITTNWLGNQALLARERQFFRTFWKTSTWTGFSPSGSPLDFDVSNTSYAPAGQWGSSTSNPMADIQNIISKAAGITGYRYNRLAVAEDVNAALLNHPAVLDRIKYTQRGIVTEELLAALFGVEKYKVARAISNTAQEGEVEASDYLVKNQFLLTYCPPGPSVNLPSAGYIWSWTGRLGNSAFGSRVKVYRDEPITSDVYLAEMAFGMNTVGTDLGVLGTNVLAVA